MATVHPFTIPPADLALLLQKYPNAGKNSHIGDFAVAIVQLYFQSQDRQATCTIINDGTDLEICCHGETKRYEVKGTADGEVAYHKLKVSSKASHAALVSGTTLIRVTNVGQPNVQLHFLHHGIDFELIEEPRWAVRPIRKKRRNENG